jgi:hypothetical protein
MSTKSQISPTTKVQINPNLRLSGDFTMVDIDEDVFGPLRYKYQEVEVFEPTSGLRGKGWLIDVDPAERTATVSVDWPRLTLPEGNQVSSGGLRSEANIDLRSWAAAGEARVV